MNKLEDFFWNKDHKLIHKWNHYFEIYERHFKKFVYCNPRVLEFGISHGGSLEMWKHYFGEGSKIFGVDKNPASVFMPNLDATTYICDQSDRKKMAALAVGVGQMNIIIDDGSHRRRDQIITFENFYPILSSTGVYLCEDTHTNYRPGFGRGKKFIDVAKKLVDRIHSSQWQREHPEVFRERMDSITFYDSVVVIEKKERETPFDVKMGTHTIADPWVNHLDVERNW